MSVPAKQLSSAVRNIRAVSALAKTTEELWQAAHRLVEQYGVEAKREAILRSERARLNGNFAGYKSWKEIGSKAWALHTGAATY